MSENGCVLGQKIGDAEFVSIFYPNFGRLDPKEKEVAIEVTKAIAHRRRKLKSVDADSVATFYPGIKTLDTKGKEVAVEVSKAFIEKMKKEGGKRTKRSS